MTKPIKPLKGHVPFEGARIRESSATHDMRGEHGTWVCGSCGFARNVFDTVKRKTSVMCERCGDSHVLDVQAYIDKRVARWYESNS